MGETVIVHAQIPYRADESAGPFRRAALGDVEIEPWRDAAVRFLEVGQQVRLHARARRVRDQGPVDVHGHARARQAYAHVAKVGQRAVGERARSEARLVVGAVDLELYLEIVRAGGARLTDLEIELLQRLPIAEVEQPLFPRVGDRERPAAAGVRGGDQFAAAAVDGTGGRNVRGGAGREGQPHRDGGVIVELHPSPRGQRRRRGQHDPAFRLNLGVQHGQVKPFPGHAAGAWRHEARTTFPEFARVNGAAVREVALGLAVVHGVPVKQW